MTILIWHYLLYFIKRTKIQYMDLYEIGSVDYIIYKKKTKIDGTQIQYMDLYEIGSVDYIVWAWTL